MSYNSFITPPTRLLVVYARAYISNLWSDIYKRKSFNNCFLVRYAVIYSIAFLCNISCYTVFITCVIVIFLIN